jgi:hypothetical protein
MRYLEFYTSTQEEENLLIAMFQKDETLPLKYRIRQYGFPAKLARRINRLPLRTWISDFK